MITSQSQDSMGQAMDPFMDQVMGKINKTKTQIMDQIKIQIIMGLSLARAIMEMFLSI